MSVRLPSHTRARAARWLLFGLMLAAPACSGESEPRGDGRQPALIPTDAAGLLRTVREADALVVIVNVWATFCQPCREEFPDMMRLYRTYRDEGLRLLLVSADFPEQSEAARAFLREQGVDFDTYIKQQKDGAFISTLDPRWSGAIPATWVFDADGGAVAFWEGKADYGQFERALLGALKQEAD